MRSKNRTDLNAQIAAITKTASSAHWVDALNEAGVPCGPINTIDQTFADPQVQHLDITQSVRSEKHGEMEMVGQPVELERTPSSLVVAPPECGEHNDEILHDLGYSPERIDELREQKVI